MALWFIVALITVLVVAATWLLRRNNSSEKLPGPPKLPIVGNLFDMRKMKKNQKETLKEWKKKYGSVYSLSVFGSEFVVLTEYEDIRKVALQRPSTAFDNFLFDNMKAIEELRLAKGMGTLSGQKYKDLKKVIAPKFTNNAIQKQFAVIVNVFVELMDELGQLADSKTPIDNIDIITTRTTLRVVTRAAMGSPKSFNDSKQVETRMSLMINKLFNMMVKRGFSPIPYWHIPFLKPKAEVEIEKELKEFVYPFIDNVITAATKSMSRDDHEPENMIEVMIAHGFDRETVFQNSLGFYLAGTETTSGALVSTVYHLCLYPKYQDMIYEEVAPTMAQNDLSYAKFKKLKLVQNFVQEVLRMRQNGFHTAKSLKDQTIELKNGPIFLKKGTKLLLDTARATSIYKDPAKFNPDRFDNGEPTMLIFGYGRRSCTGKNLAVTELVIFLSLLCYTFKVSMAPGTRIEDVKKVYKPMARLTNLSILLERRHHV